MAINQLTQPDSGASSDNADYTAQNTLINSNGEIGRSILTDWESTTSAPAAGQGCMIRMGGLSYQVQSSDEPISGTPAAGINYIKATVTGTVMTLAFTAVTTGFTYNEQYSGVYNSSGEQLLTDICYKDGALFKRGRGNGMDFNTYILADGSVIYVGGLNTNGGSLNTVGGAISTAGGNMDTGSGNYVADKKSYVKALQITTHTQTSNVAGTEERVLFNAINGGIPDTINQTVMVKGGWGAYNVIGVKRVSATQLQIIYWTGTAFSSPYPITDGSTTPLPFDYIFYI